MALQFLHEISEIGENGVVQVPVPILCRRANRKVRFRFRRRPGMDASFLGPADGDADAREIIVDASIFSGSREGSTEESFERSRPAVVGQSKDRRSRPDPLLPLASV